MSKLFGTDGIRGVANQPPMTVDTMIRVARAATYALQARRFVIGKDTRLSSYMIEHALASGICSMGADVLLMGPMPTPGIAFLTSNMRADAGVVISASHNPFYDNGIKFFASDGYKLSDDLEARIEGWVANNEIDSHLPTNDKIGKVYRIRESKGRYIVFLKAAFPQRYTLEGVKIVLDCANGAAYQLAPIVLEELGAEVVTIGCEPNGININNGCGALFPDELAKRVVLEHADIGIGLDGDGDRAIICDEKGEVVDGDAIMAIAATHLKSLGTLAKDTLVATVMSNLGLKIALKSHGISTIETQVGDRYVVEAMRKGGYNLGGEQSGHIVFLDHTTTGDGMISALQILAIMIENKKPLSELKTVMERFPQVLKNVPVREKRPLETLQPVTQLIDQIEGTLGEKGRILVRYSGTEKLARVMVEGEDEEAIEGYAQEISSLIAKEIGDHG